MFVILAYLIVSMVRNVTECAPPYLHRMSSNESEGFTSMVYTECSFCPVWIMEQFCITILHRITFQYFHSKPLTLLTNRDYRLDKECHSSHTQRVRLFIDSCWTELLQYQLYSWNQRPYHNLNRHPQYQCYPQCYPPTYHHQTTCLRGGSVLFFATR